MPELLELVIDGTNFGGKTPLVNCLVERLRAQNLQVETASPYREVEVYTLWDENPIGAARLVLEIMNRHRQRARGADVLVWDRGWPTCYIATANSAARALFQPLPLLTFLLLNTAEVTAKKVQKYALPQQSYPWMHRHRLKDEISYEQLARDLAPQVCCFRPTLPDSRFDLDLVSARILEVIEQQIG